jgi:hypothetical protein
MGQEVKIGVSANPQPLNDVAKATDNVAVAADKVAKATKAAADGLRQMESIAQRLKGVQEILSREFGRPVDSADATVFLHNFDRMRSGGGFGAQRMRGFDSFENWYSGHGATAGALAIPERRAARGPKRDVLRQGHARHRGDHHYRLDGGAGRRHGDAGSRRDRHAEAPER